MTEEDLEKRQTDRRTDGWTAGRTEIVVQEEKATDGPYFLDGGA